MQNVVLNDLVALGGAVMNQTSPVADALVVYSIDCTPGAVTADSQGVYTFNAPVGSAVNVLLSDQSQTVTPESYVFTVTAERNDLNFVINPNVPTSYTVSGHVSGLANNAGVQVLYTIDGQVGSAVTDSLSNYSFTAPVGAVVMITPSAQSGYAATPASYLIDGISGNVCGQSFVYTGTTSFTISGTVSGLATVSGVQVFYTVNGTVGTATTDVNGNYAFAVPLSAVVSIIPSVQSGYSVLPENYQLPSVSSNVGGQNFVYTSSSIFTVSGIITGLPVEAGIPVQYTVNGLAGSTQTDALGSYTLSAPAGSAISIMPTAIAGYTVSPDSWQIESLSDNVNGFGFVYSPSGVRFTVSGTISGLATVSGVDIFYTVNELTAVVTTDENGNYAFTAPEGSAVRTVPTAQDGYTVDPDSYQITNLTDDVNGQDFVYTATDVFTVRGTLSGLASVISVPVLYTINGVTGSTLTDALGDYTISAPAGATVNIIPTAFSGYTVLPVNHLIVDLSGNVTSRNFVYSGSASFAIGGTLYGLPCNVGQSVAYTINGISNRVITDDTGSYIFGAPAGASVVITPPAKTGYSVSPVNYIIASLSGNLLGQNFVFAAMA